jgi:hypothetical protein
MQESGEQPMKHEYGKATRVDPLDKLAWYLDEAVRIPGTRIRVGWDVFIGLIPGLGELITTILQGMLVLLAVEKYQVPGVVVARMIVNVGIDAVIGAIPLLGDIFDVFFKANTRNIRLLNEARAQAERGRVSKGRHYIYLGAVFLTLLAVVAGGAFLAYQVIKSIVMYLNSLS